MWTQATKFAVHLYNRTPHKAYNYKIPLSLFPPREKVQMDKLRRFGCKSYVDVPKPTTKFTKQALETMLVGYTNTGYLLWHSPSEKFISSRNAQFHKKIVCEDDYNHESEELILTTVPGDSPDESQRKEKSKKRCQKNRLNEETRRTSYAKAPANSRRENLEELFSSVQGRRKGGARR